MTLDKISIFIQNFDKISCFQNLLNNLVNIIFNIYIIQSMLYKILSNEYSIYSKKSLENVNM